MLHRADNSARSVAVKLPGMRSGVRVSHHSCTAPLKSSLRKTQSSKAARHNMTDLSFLFVGMDEAERLARLRELRALVAVYCGWDHPAKLAFDAAAQGTSDELGAAALAEVAKLPSLT